jgi:hypothetical protein
MQFIGKSKISTLHSKPGVSYPLIRLPQQYNHLIGETAQLCITNHDGKKGFLILLEETENEGKVVKQSLETNLESRLSALESNIEEMKNLLFQKNRILTLNQQNKLKIKRPSRDLNPSQSLDSSEAIFMDLKL